MRLLDVPAVELAPRRRTRKPKNQAPKHSDQFQTPGSALWPLVPYLDRGATIWEPACGKRNLCREFELLGFTVNGTDILQGEGCDFLRITDPDAEGLGTVIVTNPPYSIKDQWIDHCYELGLPFALLLPLTALEGQFRQSLYRKHGVEALVMPRRVNFETPNDAGSSSWFPCLWLTWGLELPSPLFFPPFCDSRPW